MAVAAPPAPDTAPAPGVAFGATWQIIAEPLAELERRLQEQVRAFHPDAAPLASYALEGSGKRLRPAIVFLVGGAAGALDARHMRLAVALELIHIATLVHDDIIDGAALRRAMPTLAAKWGPALAVLAGDSVFARALEIGAAIKDPRATRSIARAAREVCEGEILQNRRRGDLSITPAEYRRIVSMKTGALFAVAAEQAAALSGRPPTAIAAMRRCGAAIGSAYQIYDDCVDLAGDRERAGKSLRADLAAGKFTLPIIHLLAAADPRQRDKLAAILLEEDDPERAARALADIADYAGALERAAADARALLADARAETLALPSNPHSEALRTLPDAIAAALDRLLRGA